MRKVVLFFLINLLFVSVVNAQAPVTFPTNDARNFALKSYTTHDGLPSENVTVALKDSRGYMWIGTDNGLCKFDGYTFESLVNIPGNTASISSNFISALAEDKNGKIWVGTMDGLNILDPNTEKFERFYHSDKIKESVSNNKIFSIFCDREGTIWIGTDDGFNQYVSNKRSFVSYKPNQNDRFSIKGKSVNAIVEDDKKNLWLGNWNGGLNKFDKVSKHFSNYPQTESQLKKSPNDIWSLFYDQKKGCIWVGTYWSGLFCFNPKIQQYTRFSSHDNINVGAFSIDKANDSTLVVGSNGGFYFINKGNGQWRKIGDINSTADGYVYNDGAGIMWLCGKDALTKVDFTQYKFRFIPLSIAPREAKSMLLQGNMLWLATNEGLYKFDLLKKTTKLYQHTNNPSSISSNQVGKIYLDNEGALWAATENGFDKFDSSNNRFIHHFHHSALSNFFNEDVFRDILEVRPLEYWLATDAGLKIYHEETRQFKHYYNDDRNPNSIASNHIYNLLKDSKGNVWIGTSGNGVDRFDPKTGVFHHYTYNDKIAGSLSNNIVHCIFEDSKKNIWICTADGLNKYAPETDSFIVYSRKNGFASNVFNSVVEDEVGNLWINSATGVSKFTPQTLAITNFDEGDGVFSHSLIYKSADGQIYLAGNSGVVVFDPSKIELNDKIPPVYFTDFQVFNKSVKPGTDSPLKRPVGTTDTAFLNYDQNVFSIEFVSLNYTHPEKNSYRYKLEGFDEKWNFNGNQRRVTYTNLNPGTYIFKVIASNNDGIWNKTPKSLIIIISPPWYRTWWAYTIYAIIIGGVVYLYLLYRDRQAKLKYEIQIAHYESEKEKELSERKLAFFTNISHEFRTPLTLIINPIKELLYNEKKTVDTSNLTIVYRNARRLLGLVDQLLLFKKAESESDQLRISNVNIIDLCREVYLCFVHEAKRKHIQLEFISPTDCLNVYIDREKTEIVLFNLLSNAMKFTPKLGTIRVCAGEFEQTVSIIVEDTGCGIPPEVGEKLFSRFYQVSDLASTSNGGFGLGLYLVKNFVERQAGTVEYHSEAGKGTAFTITLKKGKSHLKDQVISEQPTATSEFLKELIDSETTANDIVPAAEPGEEVIVSDLKTLLIIDDHEDMREYLRQIFKLEYNVLVAPNGEDGIKIINEQWPDIVICDVMMQGMTGIEVCAAIKENITTSHVPVILLTASASNEIKLKGIEGGADDYIGKPFDKDILKARVSGLLKTRNTLQQYFYNEITLNNNPHTISIEYKRFLDSCIRIVEDHITDPDFNLQSLASELNMSYSGIYKKIKMISGQPANSFIRAIRLRKAAQLFVHSDLNILETAYAVGIKDIKYFREQFKKVFDLKPSEYIKKFRKNFKNAMVNQGAERKINL
ncbi:response regulator [Mucilaginibacter rubeus]|uniref:histidine kinase n=1 Tax=Mucilaginibacter rubeus TaxID=2027860 RepID=A0AAE6JCV5_9SPHI|nr:two-component regulator propeller domain-containing protein [Mucilaginibacter rubeus]QEM02492.1 response regulator [Mucilaginibacter rubeus]QTE42163.1 response regulator [Mucilaginibacter rubeus]QTE48764.1 response regulator [Mucilaginibacter rubeus]QTE53863.1 response regulator [Mucilaginibacter rubeus]QTF65430.1 response regulator [Mucilaginibacter rubeus]